MNGLLDMGFDCPSRSAGLEGNDALDTRLPKLPAPKSAEL